jgi:hypothetical protein
MMTRNDSISISIPCNGCLTTGTGTQRSNNETGSGCDWYGDIVDNVFNIPKSNRRNDCRNKYRTMQM